MAFCLIPQKAKVVVAVVAIGHDELYKITLPTIAKWCQLHGYLLEIISTCEPYSSPFWAKFKAYDFFEKHAADCVIMLDADILIKPGSPSPADRFPKSGIHAFDSMSLPKMREFVKKQQERFQSQTFNVTGHKIPITTHYINGGVCVVWKEASDFLSPPLYESPVSTGPQGAFDDQNLMNARTAGRFFSLPRSFNWGHPHIEENFRRMKDADVYFLHLNCPEDKVAIAKQITSWPCFSEWSNHWWVWNSQTASVVRYAKIVLLRLNWKIDRLKKFIFKIRAKILFLDR